MYSRRDNNRIAASLIAAREGVIEAKIESQDDGKNEAEAFQALRTEIEKRMDQLLQDVPSVLNPQVTGAQGAPPAYEASEREAQGDIKAL